MEVRLLPQTEFDSVQFFKLFTLLILLALGVFALIKLYANAITLLSPAPLCLIVLLWRFAVEWRRVAKCQPAFIHDDELVLCGTESHRRIPLSSIRSIKSRHSFFMVRRYRSWSEHLAFLDFTLSDGEHVHTLAESAVFEFPAAGDTLKAIDDAMVAAKVKRQSSQENSGDAR